MNKKLFLAVATLLIWFSPMAWAYDFSAVCESGQILYYRITSNAVPYTVEITSSEAAKDDLVIPSTVSNDGKKYSVTGIGDVAFGYCWELTSVTIPNSVTRIGKEVFKYCNNLTSMSVGKNNPNYDSRNNCNAIIETATNTLIYGCRNTTIPNSVTSIDTYAFASCKELTTMTIPNSVKNIGNGAFAYSGITSINIPNSVTNIGEEAFAGCIGLTSINIPNSVTSIGEEAFSRCSGLTSVNIPNSLTSIGKGAFYGCDNLPKETREKIKEINMEADWGW